MSKKYIKPQVLGTTALELERDILTGSVVIDEDTTVSTAGQEIVEVDMTDYKWE